MKNALDSPPAILPHHEPHTRLRVWQGLTLTLLVVGYSGYYLCRSNLSVCQPLIEADLIARGASTARAKQQLGEILTFGTLAYVIGKILGGLAGDFFGGRRNFLLGMAGAVFFTVLFGLDRSLPVMIAAWMGNRLLQAFGWPGMVKITSRWFSFTAYGRAIGVISLSYLFGDALSRWVLGRLLAIGLAWQSVFLVAAAIMAAILVTNLILLKDAPGRIGAAEPPPNPLNVYASNGADDRPSSVAAHLLPLARSPAFWMICSISLGLTLVRESFNNWTATYFVEGVRMTPAQASEASALFPFCGGVAVLVAGYLGDRLGHAGKALLLVVGLLGSAAVLWMLGSVDLHGRRLEAVALVALIGFLLIGPYSYLSGAVALDFGGKRGSATAAGLVDAFGYIGGMAAGMGVAGIAASLGWQGVFRMLAAVVAVSSSIAAAFLIDQHMRWRRSVKPLIAETTR
jgi:OPA family glycerol-3-phosphate transporter-like MFS transporter